MMTSEKLERILTVCSSDENVKAEVIRNHDNNLWWPIDITDKRMRLLIAGLSTRISYNMIATYQQVIADLNLTKSFLISEIPVRIRLRMAGLTNMLCIK